MKKFIVIVSAVVLLVLFGNILYYQFGFYIDFRPGAAATTKMSTDEDTIYIEEDGKKAPFEIRGVNLGVGIPGKWAADYAIDRETYLRWFSWIQELGANTIRVYTLQSEEFYEAFYEYNQNREEPLYLLHGVWVNDYVQNSHRDAFDEDFQEAWIDDCKKVVDVIHGNRTLRLEGGAGTGRYRWDVSTWVIGYILGVDWEDVTVAYTDHKYPDRNFYQGTYLYTTDGASAFETMLCETGDTMIAYESNRYKEQRLLAFSNSPTTDPFVYPEDVTEYFMKCASIDVEHIQKTDKFLAGQFASYHVYPYYPDYLSYIENAEEMPKENGSRNTYREYLEMLTEHHRIPVVISEYGTSTGRGMAQKDDHTGRNQGDMSEQEQGETLIQCYEDIMASGCAGSCVFSWQDEWFKRTWNTLHAVDLERTPYWNDWQTSGQYFGLLSFEPGEEESVCYVDGDVSEWTEDDLVIRGDDCAASMKYDEKCLYILVYKKDFQPEEEVLYLPIDLTPKSGSTYCENYGIGFERNCDFLAVIDGRENSRLLVQERYEVLRAMYSQELGLGDVYSAPPDKDSPVFKEIDLMLQVSLMPEEGEKRRQAEVYETGKFTYGNGNPKSEDFNSLADFCFGGDYIELRIPWQMLNFADPSQMEIHDDYYEHYGVEYQKIDELYIGIGSAKEKDRRISLEPFALKGWGEEVTYHERRKQSYYILREYWKKLDASGKSGDKK